jgi:hypothetical protein
MGRFPLSPRWTLKDTEEALELIREVGILLHSRTRWTKGALARDKHSHLVEPDSDRAVRWCLAGALLKEEFDLFGRTLRVRNDELAYDSFSRPLRLAWETLAVCLTTVLHYEETPIDPVTTVVVLKGAERRLAIMYLAARLTELQDDPAVKHWHVLRAILISYGLLDKQQKNLEWHAEGK